MVDDFLAEVRAVPVPIDAEMGRIAIAAFERCGKGRHQAALNMGDCFAYAARSMMCRYCARVTIFRAPM